jgi:hypothetical protein
MKVRAKNNIILEDGTFVKRGTVLDDKEIAPHMRTAKHVDYEDLSGQRGLVMVLHQITYQEERSLDGHPAWFPTTVQAGAVIKKKFVEGWTKEGIDYVTKWKELVGRIGSGSFREVLPRFFFRPRFCEHQKMKVAAARPKF